MAKKRRTPSTLGRSLQLRNGQFDLSNLQIDAIRQINDVVDKVLCNLTNEVVRELFEAAEGPYVCWAAQDTNDNGHGVEPTELSRAAHFIPPLTINIEMVGTGPEDSKQEPILSFDLRESLSDALKLCRAEGAHLAGLKRISSALKEFAAEIDDAVASTPDE